MDVDTYFSSGVAGFEFLIALGSLIGLFGLVVGALLLFFGGRPFKSKGLKILLISILRAFIQQFLGKRSSIGSERGNIKKLTRRRVKPAKSRREAQW
ncbi:hypothetical protein ES705_35142 [subsurface metagenome]|uniref:Uncharacterized protein n=1 Tax=marine sediment metagenome TaxID=412755 RepID=X1GH56_9ZZZZ|nr:MAG: hypothetical protein CEE42_03670 [Candidatus Lokiarchaeota archaeon Loki_b31]